MEDKKINGTQIPIWWRVLIVYGTINLVWDIIVLTAYIILWSTGNL